MDGDDDYDAAPLSSNYFSFTGEAGSCFMINSPFGLSPELVKDFCLYALDHVVS